MLKLVPNPTFKAKVPVYVPGNDDPVMVEFEFKHKTRSDLKALVERMNGESKGKKAQPTDEDVILDLVEGWELDDPFNAASVKQLVENYHGVAVSVFNTYISAINQARAKN